MCQQQWIVYTLGVSPRKLHLVSIKSPGAHLNERREAERNQFRHPELAAALKYDVEVYVYNGSATGIQQYIVQMPVSQAQEVSHLQPRQSHKSKLKCHEYILLLHSVQQLWQCSGTTRKHYTRKWLDAE